MPGKDEVLVDRVQNYLAREIACFERVLEVLGMMHPAMDADAWEALLRRHNALAAEIGGLETEFEALAVAWPLASGVAEAERAAIRVLARRAGALAGEASAAYNRIDQDLHEQTQGIKNELGLLGQGRGLLRKYRPGNLDDALFMDRKG